MPVRKQPKGREIHVGSQFGEIWSLLEGKAAFSYNGRNIQWLFTSGQTGKQSNEKT